MTYHDLRLLLDGMLLMMAFYALFSYSQHPNPLYLWYAAYIGGITLHLRLSDFVNAQTNPSVWTIWLKPNSESLAFGCYLWFAERLMNIRKSDPFSYRLIRWMAAAFLGHVLLDTLLRAVGLGSGAALGVYLASRLFLVGCTIFIVPRILNHRNGVTTWFIIGTTCFIGSSTVALTYYFAPSLFGYNPANGFSYPLTFMQLGVVIEVMCFALGISLQNRQTELDKITAQTQLIAQLQENDRKQQRLLRIRDDIARDLHDELGSDLSAISMLATSATAALPRQPDRATANLAQIGQMARNLLTTMREIVWSLNSAQGTYQNFGLKMRETAYLLFDGETVKLHFDLPAMRQSGSVPTEYRRELLLIYKELLHNAHRHAHAQNLWISLTTDDDADKNTLVLTVRDDGRGFDPPTVNLNGNGIGFLHKRAEGLGGKFEFQSGIGNGTTARLVVECEPLEKPVLKT